MSGGRASAALACAVVSGAAGALALRAALEHPGWYVVVVPAYVLALGLLAATLRAGLPLGVAYGAWGAAGVALTAGLDVVLFGEDLTRVTVLGLVLIAAGVLLVEAGARPGRRGKVD